MHKFHDNPILVKASKKIDKFCFLYRTHLPEAVHKNKYKPLSRPLFIYVNPYSSEKHYVYQFVNFYLQKASSVADSVGYVSLPDEIYRIGVVHLNKGKVGTVFGGESQFDLTIGQLLQKQKQF
jgi:phosphate transport system substrate-binding protein